MTCIKSKRADNKELCNKLNKNKLKTAQINVKKTFDYVFTTINCLYRISRLPKVDNLIYQFFVLVNAQKS